MTEAPAKSPVSPSSLGLIGGLGPPSTIFYYQALVAAYAALGVEARLVIVQADMKRALAFVQAGDRRGLAGYLAGLIDQLAAAGAEVAAIGAVTPHICMPELVQVSDLPLIDIVDSLIGELRRRQIRRLAVLGTRFTMEARLFDRLGDFQLIDLSAAQMDEVHRIYLGIADQGGASTADKAYLTRLGRDLCAGQGAEAVVLAGTELSLVLTEQDAGFPMVDCARVHIADLVARTAPAG